MFLTIKDLCKSYGGLIVLDHLNLTLNSDKVNCLMAPSGSGKTTLFRILLRLEQADDGTITFCSNQHLNHASSQNTSPLLSAVFQEDRLCETFSPIENIRLVTGHTLTMDQIQKELAELLPAESLTRPVSTLSGGMKHRVAIARAILAPSQIIIMDEPFTGLDEGTLLTTIQFIKKRATGKLLLLSTHQEKEAELLRARIIAM